MSALFDKSLRAVAVPALEKHGFRFDGHRKFSRNLNGKEAGIEFQLGQRFMKGRFTVNLTIDSVTVRLGIIRETRLSLLINRIFGTFDPWWIGTDSGSFEMTVERRYVIPGTFCIQIAV